MLTKNKIDFSLRQTDRQTDRQTGRQMGGCYLLVTSLTGWCRYEN